MPRIAAISLARLSLKNIPRKRLLQIINVVIFISLFAVTASGISLIYEKKIDYLDKTMAAERANEIVFNYWLAVTPRKITDIKNMLNRNFDLENYLLYIKALEEKLITQRDLNHNPVIDFMRYSRLNINALRFSLEDAIVISSSLEDVLMIKKYRKQTQLLNAKFIKLRNKHQSWMLESPIMGKMYLEEKNKEKAELIHNQNILSLKLEYIKMLEDIKKIYFDFNLDYYSKKKTESESKIKNSKNKIKEYSNKESDAIFAAFIIQLIIFFVIQYFEFGFEIIQHVRRKSK